MLWIPGTFHYLGAHLRAMRVAPLQRQLRAFARGQSSPGTLRPPLHAPHQPFLYRSLGCCPALLTPGAGLALMVLKPSMSIHAGSGRTPSHGTLYALHQLSRDHAYRDRSARISAAGTAQRLPLKQHRKAKRAIDDAKRFLSGSRVARLQQAGWRTCDRNINGSDTPRRLPLWIGGRAARRRRYGSDNPRHWRGARHVPFATAEDVAAAVASTVDADAWRNAPALHCGS